VRQLGLLFVLAGCAAVSKPVAHPDERDDSADLKSHRSEAASVRLVGRVPLTSKYQYVGRVSGVSNVGDWVQTAKAARADLNRKAEALGADVIKIDRVNVPADSYRGQFVLLTGRAYRSKKAGHRPHNDED
jgi:hypothetical protein